ncbi:MAG: serine/threonine protein kinase [Gemmatimonadota bacterium]|nr:serine/threonine protein kinase [Gemmatimonadota bacterium]
MTGSHWERVKSLFAEAMELAPEERAAFIDRLQQYDTSLRDELESLLAVADGSDSFPAARAAISRTAGDAALQAMLTGALGQQYEILRPLGQGGMGAVYLARERALERFVAVKVLRPELAEAQSGRERFRREARVVAQLSHPSILPLHTFGEVSGGGTWYFVMGYVRGVSLAERLRVEGRLGSGDAHRILTELADALECAHRSGIIHRDIKPANILLDADSGRAVLADFGISKVSGGGESLTATGLVVGTPHFMSPEQALGSMEADERSDLYSLGAVGYAMLAGREPFSGVSAEQVMYRRLTHDAPLLATVAPSVPKELADVVMRCLARDPAQRWQTARAMREALARASGETASLPEPVRELPVFGPYALIWAALWTGLAATPFRSIGDRALLVLIALLVPAGLALQLWNVAGDGMSLRELTRIAFWPPEWWGMWWPRSLRRPTDLWARLPRPARAVRALLSAFIIALPTMILLREWVMATSGAPRFEVRQAFERVEVALVLVTVAGIAVAFLWALQRRLSLSDTVRVLFGATTPARGWDAPTVARVLAPRTGLNHAPAGDSPTEHALAISELAKLLPALGADSRAELSATAHALLDAIQECDAEVARLSCDASVGELDRLAAQLGAFDADAEGAAGPERRELRDLLERQLALLRRMRVRCEAVSQERARLFSLLRGLWQQLSIAHDSALEGKAASDASLGRVRDLLARISADT